MLFSLVLILLSFVQYMLCVCNSKIIYKMQKLIKCVVYLVFICNLLKVNSFNLSPQPNYIFNDPKIETFQKKYESSYFGYSLNLRKNSLMIGAPKAQSNIENQQHNNQTGAIYKCYFNNLTCTPYYMDKIGNVYKFKNIESDKLMKNYQWMGAVMDGFETEKDLFVACAPNIVIAPDYKFFGKCYRTPNTLESQPKLVQHLEDNMHNTETVKKKETLLYHLIGQQGFSLHIPKKSGEILMGSPRNNENIGRIVRITQKSAKNAELINRYIDESNRIWQLDRNSYFGYAISSALFINIRNQMNYVVSAPRGNKYKGVVFLFSINESKEEKDPIDSINIHKIFSGTQICEYFGYSLLVDDFNNDELLDLVISAPFYSKTLSFENGKVYIFQNIEDQNFSNQIELTPENEVSGRFGTSLGKIGDINLDGFNDLAIGAPFDGNGVVYIFLGSSNGLLGKPSQIIRSKIPQQPTLFGDSYMFGMSISRGVDIDENKFNDISIGSPNAEVVYVYKAYPAIKVIPNVNIISDPVKKFIVKICCKYYSGAIIPFDIQLTVILKSRDFKFVTSQKEEMIRNITITTSDQCTEHDIELKHAISNILRIFSFEFSYDLVSKIPENSNFCNTCVTINPIDERVQQHNAVLSTKCMNIVCIPVLKLYSKLLNINPRLPYIVGSKKSILIQYFIVNVGDVALLPHIKITIPHFVTFHETPKNCELEQFQLRCQLSNESLLYRGNEVEVQIAISVSNLFNKEVIIKAEVYSPGYSFDGIQNIVNISLAEFSNIEIHGKSLPPMFYVDDSNQTTQTITHNLYIENAGPSNIKEISIQFYIPLEYLRNINQSKITLIEFENIFPKCIYNNTNQNITWGEGKESKENISDYFDQNFESLPFNRTMFFHCKRKEAYFCLKGTINIKNFVALSSSINIEIKFDINIENISKIYTDDRDIITLITSSIITKRDDEKGKTIKIINFSPYTVFTKNNKFTFYNSFLNRVFIKTVTSDQLNSISNQHYENMKILSISVAIAFIIGLIVFFFILYLLYKFEYLERPWKRELENQKLNHERTAMLIKTNVQINPH